MNPENNYHHPQVRDLAWAIGSAPLLSPASAGERWPDQSWYEDTLNNYRPVLAILDNNPAELENWLDQCKTYRLGQYFEALWGFWLQTNHRYRLLSANLPVRNSTHTLGEFDLLVEDTESGQHIHWELAVKFYLGTGNTALPGNWWGPAKRDRLDSKLKRIQEHQCRLSHFPEARKLLAQLDIHVDEVWSIVKGRLFYPATSNNSLPPEPSCSAHLSGWWKTCSEFIQIDATATCDHYCLLDKPQWFSTIDASKFEALNHDDMIQLMKSNGILRPITFARIKNQQEIDRGFIVPDDWQDQLIRDADLKMP